MITLDELPAISPRPASRRTLKLALAIGGLVAIGVPAALAAVDLTKLPVGKVSTSAQRDRLWSCQTNFTTNAAGAKNTGPWMNSDGTWDKTKKASVAGSVSWPTANISITVSGSDRVITGNALPVTSKTGVYPVASSDPAYKYDSNPNSIKAQTISLKLPASPKVATSPQCAGGEVGISVDGPPIFNAVDAGGRDAQAYEVQDSCSGHPQSSGAYHYHGLSACAKKASLFGYALDGFPIWGPTDPSTGKDLTNADLDECHGTTSAITIDGKTTTMYHYVANDEYPYTVGCFRGTPSANVTVGGGTGGGTGGGAGGGTGGGGTGGGGTGTGGGTGGTGGPNSTPGNSTPGNSTPPNSAPGGAGVGTGRPANSTPPGGNVGQGGQPGGQGVQQGGQPGQPGGQQGRPAPRPAR